MAFARLRVKQFLPFVSILYRLFRPFVTGSAKIPHVSDGRWLDIAYSVTRALASRYTQLSQSILLLVSLCSIAIQQRLLALLLI